MPVLPDKCMHRSIPFPSFSIQGHGGGSLVHRSHSAEPKVSPVRHSECNLPARPSRPPISPDQRATGVPRSNGSHIPCRKRLYFVGITAAVSAIDQFFTAFTVMLQIPDRVINSPFLHLFASSQSPGVRIMVPSSPIISQQRRIPSGAGQPAQIHNCLCVPVFKNAVHLPEGETWPGLPGNPPPFYSSSSHIFHYLRNGTLSAVEILVVVVMITDTVNAVCDCRYLFSHLWI